MTEAEREFRKQLHLAIARNIEINVTNEYLGEKSAKCALAYVEQIVFKERERGTFDGARLPSHPST